MVVLVQGRLASLSRSMHGEFRDELLRRSLLISVAYPTFHAVREREVTDSRGRTFADGAMKRANAAFAAVLKGYADLRVLHVQGPRCMVSHWAGLD